MPSTWRVLVRVDLTQQQVLAELPDLEAQGISARPRFRDESQ